MSQSAIKEKIYIRWMIRRDMPAVLNMEESSFEFHWPEEVFLWRLRQRNCQGMIAELNGEPIGFMVYELYKKHVALVRFVVEPRYRRQGVGSAMLAMLESKLSFGRRDKIIVEVRERNLIAQKFFRQLGFTATLVLRDHYDEVTEDAYLMQFEVIPF